MVESCAEALTADQTVHLVARILLAASDNAIRDNKSCFERVWCAVDMSRFFIVSFFCAVSARIAPDPSRRYAAVEVDPMILEAAREDPMALDLLEEVIQMAIDQATESANRGGGGGK